MHVHCSDRHIDPAISRPNCGPCGVRGVGVEEAGHEEHFILIRVIGGPVVAIANGVLAIYAPRRVAVLKLPWL